MAFPLSLIILPAIFHLSASFFRHEPYRMGTSINRKKAKSTNICRYVNKQFTQALYNTHESAVSEMYTFL